MNKSGVVDMMVRKLNSVVTDVSVYDKQLDRTAIDFNYRFSTPREFRSSVIVSESGSISRFELRLPAVRRKRCELNDVPKRYTEMEVHEKTNEAVQEADFPIGTKVEINTDLDGITYQPHVICDNLSLIPRRVAPCFVNLPNLYLKRIPEHHHVRDNTK